MIFTAMYMNSPGQKSWSTKELVQLTLSKAHSEINPLPDGLLPSEGKSQVDAIQCHPINFSLPTVPVPPHKGITWCTNILVVSEPTGIKITNQQQWVYQNNLLKQLSYTVHRTKPTFTCTVLAEWLCLYSSFKCGKLKCSNKYPK